MRACHAIKDGIALKIGNSFGKGLGNSQYTNFAPRFGFAYQVTEKLVARGGFGLFYNPIEQLVLEPGKKYFVNVGSVGQPRDGDWRAAYVVFDEERRTVRLRRLTYDLPKTQEKILSSGLPPRLADRLAFGK